MRLVALFCIFSAIGLGQDAGQLMNEGTEALKAGKFVEAVDAFQKVVDADPLNQTAHTSLARALSALASRKYQEAQRAPDPATKMTQLDESAAWYGRLARLDPGNKVAF